MICTKGHTLPIGAEICRDFNCKDREVRRKDRDNHLRCIYLQPGAIDIMYGWSMDKRLDDFVTVADNLLKEGQTSRAETILYLIERCKRAEARVKV